MILAVFVVGLIFLLIGIGIAARPDLYVKLTKQQIKLVWAAEFKPSKTTESRMRGLGFFYFLIGAVVLYVHLVLSV